MGRRGNAGRKMNNAVCHQLDEPTFFLKAQASPNSQPVAGTALTIENIANPSEQRH